MAKIKVKNKNHTTGKTPEIDPNWLAFWEKTTEKKATSCENIGCNNTDNIVGAHVIKGVTRENGNYCTLAYLHKQYVMCISLDLI